MYTSGNQLWANFLVDGTILISNQEASSFHILDPTGTEILKSIAPGPTPGCLKCPQGAGFLKNGNIVMAEASAHRLSVFDKTGKFIRVIGEEGHGPGQFKCPHQLLVDLHGQVVVADSANNRIQIWSPELEFVKSFPCGSDTFPTGIIIDILTGNYLITAKGSKEIIFMNPESGEIVKKIAVRNAETLMTSCQDCLGNIVAIDFAWSRIHILNPEGRLLYEFGEFGYHADELCDPVTVALDEDGNLLISDFYNKRIVLYG